MRNLTKEEIEEAYEKNTGVLIATILRIRIMRLFRQFSVKIMVLLPGGRMPMRRCIMQ